MSRYLNPRADVVFKKIFGEHPHLLKSFLNAVLPLADDNKIIELTYLPVEQAPKIPSFKRTIVDVKCIDSQGRAFIVEMQMEWTDNFKQRLLFGTSQAIVKQLMKGEDYCLLQPVYGLGIVSTIYEKNNAEWYHHYQLVRKGNGKNHLSANHTSPANDVIEHLQLIFIELPKLNIQSTEQKRLRLLWLRFLREIDEKTTNVSQDLLEVPEISEAIMLAEQAAYTPGELLSYESYWDAVSTEKTLLSGRLSEGRAEGRAEGIQMGEAAILLRLIKRKFTELSPEQALQIQQASADQLLEWGDRILEAKSLDELFKA